MVSMGVPAWQTVGYVYNGEVYCVDCGLPDGVQKGDCDMTVMAGEENALELVCCTCHSTLEETL